ncbi:PQQ-dependent dehydrogenase, methanol/ethanol family [Sphingopyxis macrogoltabida]|uniref:Pyrrolo-quinoline quinone n=1 Tax=Sphingopyxis macrogoltabida TaxID=33050 RepID=A0AAC9AW82_SPHMC|nr:PQQ-dependent dehydrogenase, methanol/ethanol family [Sphingopyxis macrogoltabida]ALJ14767.1 pyrrolo-quinoline quinone dependent dehydrogenase [Sphingopyxis macrogoltabida]AMU91023.1 pyrrolo-quinoline quinone [Sphingopyxis macrogoltabida]
MRGWRKLVLSVAAALPLAACGGSGDDAGATAAWMRETAQYYTASEVDAANVEKLGVAWEFTGFAVRGRTNRGVEATPIVVDGVMYTTGPWSVVYALDAKTGKLLWQYDPDVDGQFARRTCCDAVNRGVAVDDGMVYVATLDGYLVGLDAKTGKPSWKVDTITDRSRSYAITGAPRVAGKNVVIGNGGGEMGVRGYASAFDKKTGKFAWRFFIVPGDPAAGPDEHPEVTEARKTWDPKSAWDLGGGGTAWDSIVYDPDTNIVYVGTGNGSPHSVWQRSPAGGDNLYLSSILALDADSGRKKWHYQTTPQDSWDYTATQNMILTDMEVGGRLRKVIMQAPKNGFFYVLDRVTGELLSAEKYTTVTWAERVDMKTGRPVLTEQSDFSKGKKLVWPSEAGGHNWPPMAYNEQTKLVYIPVLETPMTFQMKPQPYRPYSVVQGTETGLPAFGDPNDKALAPLLKDQPKPRFEQVLKAWDPVKQKLVWSSKVMPFWSGGVMTTANGLVMQGSADGYLTVYDGRTGKVLRRINIGTGIMAAPMAYEVDGEQYVAVAAGFGGAMNAYFMPGWAAAERENNPRLIVFKLDGAPVKLAALRKPMPLLPAPANFRGTAAQVARGGQLFAENCSRCHGDSTGSGGYPNLWKMTPETHEAFNSIVLDGAFVYAGMAAFGDILSKNDARDIHAYLAEPVAVEPATALKSIH